MAIQLQHNMLDARIRQVQEAGGSAEEGGPDFGVVVEVGSPGRLHGGGES